MNIFHTDMYANLLPKHYTSIFIEIADLCISEAHTSMHPPAPHNNFVSGENKKGNLTFQWEDGM